MYLAVNHGFSPWSNPSPLSINGYDLYYKLVKKKKKQLKTLWIPLWRKKADQSPHRSLNIRLPTKWTLHEASNLAFPIPGLQKSLSTFPVTTPGMGN